MAACKACSKEVGHDSPLRIEVQLVARSTKCESCGEAHVERAWADFCSTKCLCEYAVATEFQEEINKITKP